VPTQSLPHPPLLPQPTHTDVYDIVVVVRGTAVADPSIQHVDAANTARNLEHVLLRDVLSTLSDQPQQALRHPYPRRSTQPNGVRLSFAAELCSSQMEFYHSLRAASV